MQLEKLRYKQAAPTAQHY